MRNVLTGDVQIIPGAIRITVRLIEPASDSILWSDTYDEDLTAKSIFDIQSDIAHQIVNALKAVLSPAEEEHLNKLPTENMAALEAFFIGNSQPRTREGLEAAVESYEKAILLDADYAQPYAALAAVQTELAHRSGRAEFFDAAEENIKKALELNNRLGGPISL